MKNIKLTKFKTFFELNLLDDIKIEGSEIENIIDNYEKIFSRFLENSELSIINKNWAGKISALFLDLLTKNIELYKLTNWYFNPFIEVDNIWYNNRWENNFKIKEEKSIDLIKNIELNGNNLKILNNLKIDFWWSAKWFLVDIIAKYLKDKNAKNFFINFWWDIYISWKNWEKKWNIWIENPFLKWKNIWLIELENMSVSSSWSYIKKWEINWEKYHHIINPKTWKNENEITMITIIAQKTFFSDSIATAVYNMWIEKALNFLNENNLDWLIIWTNSKAYLSKNFKEKYNFKK